MKKTILIIEDDADIASLLQHYLQAEGYEVHRESDGVAGLKAAKTRRPHLIVLDLMLPGLDGLQVCSKLRQDGATVNIPILMLTAKGEETDKIIGLELGADDYVTKPFSPRELMARIKALLRRYEQATDFEKIHHYGELTLDTGQHEAFFEQQKIELTSKEFGLLERLLQHVGRVQTREALLNAVWGDDYYGGSRTVDVHVRKLREKIPQLAEDIVTVKNLGYKLRIK
jgi:DNA-binding response OmpR family regulator